MLLSSPTGGSSVLVSHDYQRVAFKTFPSNGHATENGSQPRRGQLAVCVPDVVPNHHGRSCKGTEGGPRMSSWVLESSSQAEENSTDPHDTLTESSTLTFVDAHTTEDSSSLLGLGTVHLKEFVLIDDDDDGDMSLREKTVTDMSLMDGGAAELVCRRLFSTSSGSVSDGKVESPAPDQPGPEDSQRTKDKTRCCLCSIL